MSSINTHSLLLIAADLICLIAKSKESVRPSVIFEQYLTVVKRVHSDDENAVRSAFR